MVLEDRSYQKKDFAKIFNSTLALTLHIHFYFNLKQSSLNSHSSLKRNLYLVYPKVHPKVHTALRILSYFSSKMTKNWEKKLLIMFVLKNRSILQIFSSLHPALFAIAENFPAMHCWRKVVFMKPNFYCYSPKRLRLFFIC